MYLHVIQRLMLHRYTFTGNSIFIKNIIQRMMLQLTCNYR